MGWLAFLIATTDHGACHQRAAVEPASNSSPANLLVMMLICLAMMIIFRFLPPNKPRVS